MSNIFSDLAETLGQKTTESMRAIQKDFEDLGSQENEQITDLETKFYRMVEGIHDEMKSINERLNKVERKSNATTPGEIQRRVIWIRSRDHQKGMSQNMKNLPTKFKVFRNLSKRFSLNSLTPIWKQKGDLF